MLEIIKFVVSKASLRREPQFPPNRHAQLPTEDSVELIASDTDKKDERLGYAEGQSFIIEYEDSKGDLSERRISVWDIIPGKDNIPCLLAKCHERKATRQFRIDRILSIIDFDGEVHEPPTNFLIEAFGMEPAFAEAAETGEINLPDIRQKLEQEAREKERWEAIKKDILPHIKALAGLAWSDGYMTPDERGVILDHALQLSRNYNPSDNEVDKICNLIKRQYPSEGAIKRAVSDVWESNFEHRQLFLVACARLVEADGVISEEELAFLEQCGVGS